MTSSGSHIVNIYDYLLLIFPLALMFILFFRAKVAPKGSFNEDAWSLDQSKKLQGIAALLIILHHMVQSVTEYAKINKGPITAFCSFGILFTSIFFFFSGYGLYKSYLTKENYLDNFIVKRFPKILVPFLVTNIIYLFTNSTDRVTNVFQITTSIFGFTLLNTNAWFIVEILILYLSFYFIFSKVKDDNRAFKFMTIFTVLLILFSLLLCHDYTDINGHWFQGEWWYNTTFLFICGMYVAKNESIIREKLTASYKKILPICTAILILFYFFEEFVLANVGYYQEWKHHPGYESKLLSLICQIILCMIFMLFVLLVNMKVSVGNKLLKFLGGISLEMYLIHDIFRWGILNPERMPDIEYFALVIVFTIPLAYLLKLGCAALQDFIEGCLKNFDKIKASMKKTFTYSEDFSFEARREYRIKARVLIIIASFYVIAFVTLLITGSIKLYQNTIDTNKTFKEEMAALNEAGIGDTVYYGKYMIEYAKGEPQDIPWIVLDRQDSHVLLVSKYVLVNSQYHIKHKQVQWLDSDMCEYLNSDFYENVFSQKEKRQICGAYNEFAGQWCTADEDAFIYSKDDIKVLRPLVFLLSKDDVDKYMPNSEDRLASATYFARLTGINTKDFKNNYVGWWLSTLGTNDYSAMYIDDDGDINTAGKTVNNTGMGMRPAMWISLE